MDAKIILILLNAASFVDTGIKFSTNNGNAHLKLVAVSHIFPSVYD